MRLTQRLADIDQALPRRIDTAGDLFRMKLNGIEYRKRPDAGARLLEKLRANLKQARTGTAPADAVIGEVAGFPISMKIQREWITLSLVGSPIAIGIPGEDLGKADPLGIVMRLENRARALEDMREESSAELQRATKEISAAEDRIGRPFD